MKFNQLRALVAVANAGSIQEAARLLHLTQPALSKSIRELERELGVSLLVRSAKGATLNPYGVLIAKRSRAIQKEVDKIAEEIDSMRGAQGGRLAIGLTPPAGGIPVAEAISAFRSERPSVELQLLEMRPAQITEGLRDGVLDLGLISQYGESVTAKFTWSKLYSQETLLAIGGKRTDPRVSIDELRELEWLALDAPDDPNGYISTLFSQFRSAAPARVVRCSSLYLYRELGSRLNAVTHWSQMAFGALEPAFQEGRMTRLELAGPMPRLNVFLVYPDEDLLTPTATQFVKVLTAVTSKRRSSTKS